MPELPHPQAGLIDVAAAVIFRNGHLLITQRRAADPLGGLWEFPGGKREPGETLEACLRRELKEELALDAEPQELLDSITHRYPDKTVALHFYRCACDAGEPQILGCQALAWITLDQLDAYVFPAADQQFLVLLKSRKDLWGTPVGPLDHGP